MKIILSAIIVLLFTVVLLNIWANLPHGEIVADEVNRYNSTLFNKEPNEMKQKPLSVLLQYVAPQHALSWLAGYLAESQLPWLKNFLISYFLSRHDVDMKNAVIENPYDYVSFNDFFTRRLKSTARPIAPEPLITSPADGYVSQVGTIQENVILQAKGFNYSLTSLLGGSTTWAAQFSGGKFATFYLAPHNYHRVHIPIQGKLIHTIYIPGSLFSVNQITAHSIPNLFARNERLVCLFDTKLGPMAVILVGAMLVGSIETIWNADTSTKGISELAFDGSIKIPHGAELGHFKMGSTVIVLFGPNKMEWSPDLKPNTEVHVGQPIGKPASIF